MIPGLGFDYSVCPLGRDSVTKISSHSVHWMIEWQNDSSCMHLPVGKCISVEGFQRPNNLYLSDFLAIRQFVCAHPVRKLQLAEHKVMALNLSAN